MYIYIYIHIYIYIYIFIYMYVNVCIYIVDTERVDRQLIELKEKNYSHVKKKADFHYQ